LALAPGLLALTLGLLALALRLLALALRLLALELRLLALAFRLLALAFGLLTLRLVFLPLIGHCVTSSRLDARHYNRTSTEAPIMVRRFSAALICVNLLAFYRAGAPSDVLLCSSGFFVRRRTLLRLYGGS
jgi:hypothetical protein